MRIAVTALLSVTLLWSSAAQADPKQIAVLQGLDKVTARTSTFEVPIDQSIDFGALRIRVRHCDKTPPEERPEATAFVEIDELRPGQEQKVLFTGWMFASSPGLHAVEHAVYDVWLLDCKDPS
ncbi:MAG: DUF2155 domain-containing protein [Alphaproteobacteria bacterium]|nr:DUF2155 domain-containing protein [Alphaproteobacteria bacterium]